MQETERKEYKKISHEMGVGNHNAETSVKNSFTDVKNLVTRDEIGVMTKNVVM